MSPVTPWDWGFTWAYKLGLYKGKLKLFRHGYVKHRTLVRVLKCPSLPKIAQSGLIWIKDWSYH